MPFFAKLGALGYVLGVIVADQAVISSGVFGDPAGYVEVFPNGSGRGYAGRGFAYNAGSDSFSRDANLNVDSFALLNSGGYNVTAGLTTRSQSYDPTKKNLVLIIAGQSNCTSINPTLYVPTNSAAIDNFNIHDGLSYAISGPLLGTNYVNGTPGNVGVRVADLLVANKVFDRVILVPVCIGNTTSEDWLFGSCRDRIGVALRRLISRGYQPGARGLTFYISWWQGESDGFLGVPAATYRANMTGILAYAQVAGFSCANCKFFVNVQTWTSGTVYPAIQGAQYALVNNSTFFAGGNLDTLNASNRQADNTHLNDAGAAGAALLVYNAIK